VNQVNTLLALTSLAIIGGAIASYEHSAKEQARIKAELVVADSTIYFWQAKADSLATAYRVDTIRFTSYRLRTDTMTTTVELWKHDTLKVVEYVTRADSTIKACTLALHDCEARVGAVQHALDASQSEVRTLKAHIPPPGQKWVERAIGFGAGYVFFRVVR
jgi:hypothetical protein